MTIHSFLKGRYTLKEKKAKYKQIIDAAIVVIAENGYHSAQVSKIAKQAGVADGTIYLYFKNKEDILISLFRERLMNHIAEVKKSIDAKQTAAEKLFALIEKHFQMLVHDRNLAVVLQLELRQVNKELRRRINEIFKEYLKVIDEVIEFGKKTGEFRQDLDLRLARQMIFGTMDETATTWVMKDQKYDLLAIAEKIPELLINGFKSNHS